MDIAMNLKMQLQYYLEKRGLTASQLAKQAGVPKQSLSGWIAGSNPRDIRQVKRVSDVLGVTVDNLMFGNGSDATETATDLDALFGDQWISGLFEVRLRRVKK